MWNAILSAQLAAETPRGGCEYSLGWAGAKAGQNISQIFRLILPCFFP